MCAISFMTVKQKIFHKVFTLWCVAYLKIIRRIFPQIREHVSQTVVNVTVPESRVFQKCSQLRKLFCGIFTVIIIHITAVSLFFFCRLPNQSVGAVTIVHHIVGIFVAATLAFHTAIPVNPVILRHLRPTWIEAVGTSSAQLFHPDKTGSTIPKSLKSQINQFSTVPGQFPAFCPVILLKLGISCRFPLIPGIFLSDISSQINCSFRCFVHSHLIDRDILILRHPLSCQFSVHIYTFFAKMCKFILQFRNPLFVYFRVQFHPDIQKLFIFFIKYRQQKPAHKFHNDNHCRTSDQNGPTSCFFIIPIGFFNDNGGKSQNAEANRSSVGEKIHPACCHKP